MNELFLNILNRSISAGWLVFVVVGLRFLLKKAPRWVNVLLWGMVAFRLLCPFSIESAWSLIPSAETVSPGIVLEPVPSVHTGVPAINRVINPVIGSSLSPAPGASANPLQIWIPILSFVWGSGAVVLILYAAISCRLLQRKVATAVLLQGNIFQCEYVDSPFVLGVFNPKIYLPYHMDEQDFRHVVAHEQAHIRRKDHWWKPLGFLLLSIHWFHPLMWLAYVLLCRDIELACDEAVIKTLDHVQRAGYTQALMDCTVTRRRVAACPLAFGEVSVKDRIKSVMHYQKPAFWVIFSAILLCVAVAVCFLTNPTVEDASEHGNGAYYLKIGADGVRSIQISGTQTSAGVMQADGSGFRKGETVWLEPLEGITDLRGISITAFGEDGEIIYVLSVPEGLPDTNIINLITSDDWLLTPENLIHTGKTYVYEKRGFPDSFTLTLYPDGTFTYYEGMLSSYLGTGSWEQTDDIITLTDREIAGVSRINHFRLEGETLVFVAQASSNFMYVNVKNAERFHYTEGSISHIGGMTRPERVITAQKLTLEDVLTLSEKGQELTWIDFENYTYVETGSGLYIREYEIDEHFVLRIGGSGPDSDPMYIYLSLSEDPDTRIDIRDGGVAEFIAADHSGALLTKAVYDAILEHNTPANKDGLYNCASFVLLDKQELCISSDPPTPMQVIVYGMALHQAYSFPDIGIYEALGSHIPVALTFEEENGKYTLLDYWEPRDGSYYAGDIRDKFPDAVEDDAMDTQKYILQQKQNTYDQAVRYGGVDAAAAIEHLLEAIISSPAHSSDPGDYIDEHPIDYRELTYYGQHTLQYCFRRFLQGGQTDLTGHVMAQVCRDIMLGRGEGYTFDEIWMTGQDWFDAFQNNAVTLSGQYSDAELEKLYPGARLLLQMSDFICGYPTASE